jgi:nucleoside 2-deoxyribosyltransferase
LRIYVATKWEESARARQVMVDLVFAGHTITYDWTQAEQFSEDQAMKDKFGVMSADALVFIAEKDRAYSGALVEFGIAVARGIPIYILGPYIDQCIFTLLPQVHRGIDGIMKGGEHP